MSETVNVNLSKTSKDAVKALKTLTADFGDYFEVFKNEVASLDEWIEAKANLQSQIKNLKNDFDEAKRRSDLDLELLLKRSKGDAFVALAGELGYRYLTDEDYADVLDRLNNCEKKVEAAVGKEKGIAKRDTEAVVANLELRHTAQVAENVALIKAMEREILGKNAEINQLRGQIDNLTETLTVASRSGSVNQQIGKV